MLMVTLPVDGSSERGWYNKRVRARGAPSRERLMPAMASPFHVFDLGFWRRVVHMKTSETILFVKEVSVFLM